MAKVQQVKYLLPTEAQDPIILKSTGPDHGGHVYRLRQPGIVERGDLRLSDPRRAAAARDGRRRRFGRHPRRPDLCDAAVARPGADGGARHLGRATSPPRSAPTTSSRRRARRKAISPSPMSTPIPASTDVDQFKKMVVKAEDGAVVRMEDIANVDLDAQSWTSSIEMNGQHAVFIGVQATPTGNPLTLVAGIRAAAARDRAQPAAVGQDAGRLRFDQVHPGLDRRGQDRRSARRSSSSSA